MRKTRLIHAEGKVVRGRGKGAERIAALDRCLRPILGASPVPGTVNIVLLRPIEFDPAAAVLTIDGKRMFWPIRLGNLPCLAYRWRGCPLHIVEVVSTMRLRDELGLADGSMVRLEVADPWPLRTGSLLAWLALWAFRKERYYGSESYAESTKRWPLLRGLAGQRASA